MSDGVALRKVATGWEFTSEAALEKFIWENLPALFQLKPLKRQYITTTGESCDLLAVDQQGGLVVLELKNGEDRYLIQQLTRYYASLLEAQPFAPEIDYNRPIQLVALAPTFHRHNLIDRQCHALPFKLLQFAIKQEEQSFYLVLQAVGERTVQTHPLPDRATIAPTIEDVTEPPSLLTTWLGGCTAAEQEGFLRIRSKLLACHARMQEIIDKKAIQYGAGKTRLCAEMLFQQKTQKPSLFLRLPTPSTYNRVIYAAVDSNEVIGIRKPVIGRLRLWTDGQTLSQLGHVPEGFGTMKSEAEWQQMPPEKRPKFMRDSLSSRSHTPVKVEHYLRRPEAVKQFLGCAEVADGRDAWDLLADLAIETWLERFG